MDGEWATVSGKKKHKYTKKEAQRLELMATCRNLAPALRSTEVEALFEEGWEYGGILKASDDVVPDSSYRHKFVPVKDNPWGDSIILRKLYVEKNTTST